MVDRSMVTNEVVHVGLYHRLRMAATGSLLLSMIIAMMFLVYQAPNKTSPEDVLLSSSLSSSLQNPKITTTVVLKTSKNIRLDRKKKALKSLEVLAASRHAVAISIFSLFPIGVLISTVQAVPAKQEIDPKFMVNVTKQALATLPMSLQKLGAFMASLSFVEGQEGVDCTRCVQSHLVQDT